MPFVDDEPSAPASAPPAIRTETVRSTLTPRRATPQASRRLIMHHVTFAKGIVGD